MTLRWPIAACVALALMAGPTGVALARDHDRDHHHERHRHHDDDHSAAGVIAGVAIAGVLAAAIASSKKKKERERERYYRDDDYYYHHDREAFAPRGSHDTWCYPQTRSCYTDGYYSSRWTSVEFGHDRRF